MHDLDELDANRFITRLHEANITSDKIKQANGQWAISVEKSDSMNAIKYLSDARMFKNQQSLIPQKSSLVSSKEDQRFNFERAVSHELERTLSGMPEVLDARVHLNLPASDPIFGNRLPDSKGSGSVLLVVSDNFSSNMSQVKDLIAGAAGIEKTAISIIVSREKQTGSPALETTPASVPQEGVLPESVRKYSYLGTALILAVLGVCLIVRQIFKKRSVAPQNLNENDLYELARDLN
jgi:type III secretory pathway lipoprotein EscJ